MTISDDYRRQLQQMHASRPYDKKWGTTGGRNGGYELVRTLEGRADVRTVLDFGAGQGTLGGFVQPLRPLLDWHEYDPGIPGKNKLPEREFDFIVSTDVMEHVEPEQLDSVIRWQQAHATKGMFHLIACDPCGLTLPDGRNAHLITERLEWWVKQYTHPDWILMRADDCLQLKRGVYRRHCIVQLDRR